MNTPEVQPEKFDLKNFELIDVRSPEEFSGELGHIKGSKSIPLGENFEKALDYYSKDQKIVFICRSGNRSGKATAFAISRGFKRVYNLNGGMLLWNKLNLEIES